MKIVAIVLLTNSICLSILAQDAPVVHDDRLQVTLLAEDPEIVTPIGMAIDSQDRLFVIESHTHHPPADYSGPKSDHIKVFIDRDYDGKVDETYVCADGINQAMNLAFSPDGELFVVCAREVLKVHDEDRDGRAENVETVLTLETEERYAHNSLLGITFDRDGWMYVARGNTGSKGYHFVGTDQSKVSGYGDGGSVIRCRPDGTRLEEFATGFWNPFDLKFDQHGNLLLVDNDPDARGPNRLVHVVKAGDYGYRSLYGGSGNHPFQGWDGSLPGTLPFLAGTGEAPCSVIDCQRSNFPIEYSDSVLVSIWNENSIERFDVKTEFDGLAVTDKSNFMSGGKDFRPVALDCDSQGNLYVTDWVLVNYPNHGRGRIWRISNIDTEPTISPRKKFAPPLSNSWELHAKEIRETDDEDKLVEALQSDSAMLRHVAVQRLAQIDDDSLHEQLSQNSHERVRLGALLADRIRFPNRIESIRRWLQDPSEEIRLAALVWAGESMNIDLRGDLQAAITQENVSTQLFATYLAAVQNLDSTFIEAYQTRAAAKSNQLPRPSTSKLLIEVAKSPKFSESVQAHAVRFLDLSTAKSERDWLTRQIQSEQEELALAAIRKLGELPLNEHPELVENFVDTCLDDSAPAELRCEALLAISTVKLEDPQRLIPLLSDENESIATETARTFRSWFERSEARECREHIDSLKLSPIVRDRISGPRPDNGLSESESATRPDSHDEWTKLAMKGGIEQRGRRVFFTDRVGCFKCHTVDGRGGVLGPDLSRVALSKSRSQIIHSILEPSAEFPPQYQAWMVATTEGKIYRGLQLDHKAGGAIEMISETGDNLHFKANQIEDYAASPKSLMPDGLIQTMTVGEFQDLVEFLNNLK
ncbi:PVC-type heme-binding CxxCH protein [Thalassoglobus sp. JC818]|uniref:PVC-type heme-binding CxxCH protein n=1 Tax=Thalassoglobus sp. JC818 TaxID=3232136 RepID=UPI00345B4867